MDTKLQLALNRVIKNHKPSRIEYSKKTQMKELLKLATQLHLYDALDSIFDATDINIQYEQHCAALDQLLDNLDQLRKNLDKRGKKLYNMSKTSKTANEQLKGFLLAATMINDALSINPLCL